MTEKEFVASAPLADALIDHWTLERVGRAVRKGEELPEVVKAIYASIMDNLDAFNGQGELVSSFSNGVDSYTFDNSNTEAKRIENYAMSILPVEWISACADWDGGVRYAG